MDVHLPGACYVGFPPPSVSPCCPEAVLCLRAAAGALRLAASL